MVDDYCCYDTEGWKKDAKEIEKGLRSVKPKRVV